MTSLQFVKCMRTFDIYSGISSFAGTSLETTWWTKQVYSYETSDIVNMIIQLCLIFRSVHVQLFESLNVFLRNGGVGGGGGGGRRKKTSD